MNDGGVLIRFQNWQDIFLFAKASRPILGPTEPLTERLQWTLSPWSKATGTSKGIALLYKRTANNC
jgi:hypothetical protein